MKNEGKRIASEAQTKILANTITSLSMTNSQVPPPPPNPPELIRLLNDNQGSWNHGNNFEQSQSSTSGKYL